MFSYLAMLPKMTCPTTMPSCWLDMDLREVINTGLSGTAGDHHGESRDTSDSRGMTKPSVEQTLLLWMEQPVKAALAMTSSTSAASVECCSTARGPWEPTNGPSPENFFSFHPLFFLPKPPNKNSQKKKKKKKKKS